jgi:hypothetical protein
MYCSHNWNIRACVIGNQYALKDIKPISANKRKYINSSLPILWPSTQKNIEVTSLSYLIYSNCLKFDMQQQQSGGQWRGQHCQVVGPVVDGGRVRAGAVGVAVVRVTEAIHLFQYLRETLL